MILDRIVEQKKETLKELKKTINIPLLEDVIKHTKTPPSFYQAMAKPGLSIIGEIKKASPSKGVIKEDFNPKALAKEYETCVDAVSVLTEEKFFLGDARFLKEIHEEIDLPLLRKDFIIDPIQIYEARALGASCVLLIVAILEDSQLRELVNISHSLYMDTLIEVHDEHELARALKTNGEIIGINNRNLKDFSIDLQTTINLRKEIPEDKIVISESGIFDKGDIFKLKKSNIHGILVGESFMRSENIRQKAEEFRKAYDS
ncbi:MAG: indole-3-glycerol phosphate synthase [Epulopiscium sp.]|jgi:indole-3-glycerol phosphate synthase|uniref:Indole-3-glycerol phosphate synthase n=1 Tax=Defluviitalea raffinosedens TaxID=1450156 RepID=A0A7C8LP59_9FIRM|nr:indole-3-glycerol phosphate synthase TrpC [Defluviitalea raffinosedens]MBZ4667350.1 trpC [Defluviitaleaceae bacterium]MDK2787646.1 indole-3-glycerol phosphate synthase [Candidatus Epulonipiscium sp.]KAE9632919.1 indole-3-glycerol phosphate synthase TrpC [Defluviitalea raffinosedens]MBM7684615.1 indole-3-glycerol phosphate synthase [Defluviitalea raffinosedens]HHW68284.1 indole-3-glycerol phosphate synthase TrpC [Candidatus Epulonipiscium sp.]